MRVGDMPSRSAGWRTLGASVIGSAHITGALPCQDAHQIATVNAPNGRATLVLVAADGAGSAAYAAEGAALACATFVEIVTPYLTEEPGTVAGITRALADDWVWAVGERLRLQAGAADRSVREYACTLVAALVGDDALAGFQVGDGAIVIAEGPAYRPLFWPQRGEYANMTHFVSEEDALRHLAFAVVPGPPDEVAVLTDGLQALALTFATQSAHTPFFAPMFAPLRAMTHPGAAVELLEPLTEFLASRTVTRRTDDDTTLLLATRREPVHDPPAPVAPLEAAGEGAIALPVTSAEAAEVRPGDPA